MRGADVKSGFCKGASNIKCCPTSKVKDEGNNGGSDNDGGGVYGYDYGGQATTKKPDDRASCNRGQVGFCIDTNSEECDGAAVKSGFCDGAAHIKCCPSSKVEGSSSDDLFESDDDANSGIEGCKKQNDKYNKGGDCFDPCVSTAGVAGTCFDSRLFECNGAVSESDVCIGGKTRTCCPQPGMVDKRPFGDDDDIAGGRVEYEACNGGVEGSCIDTEKN